MHGVIQAKPDVEPLAATQCRKSRGKWEHVQWSATAWHTVYIDGAHGSAASTN